MDVPGEGGDEEFVSRENVADESEEGLAASVGEVDVLFRKTVSVLLGKREENSVPPKEKYEKLGNIPCRRD